MKKLFLVFIALQAATGAILEVKPSSSQLKEAPDRKLINSLSNASNSPELLVQHLQNSNTGMDAMTVQSIRQAEMKAISSGFHSIEEKIDAFRDQFGNKINELQLSVQKQHIPMIGAGPMVTHPYTAGLMTTANSQIAGYPTTTPSFKYSMAPMRSPSQMYRALSQIPRQTLDQSPMTTKNVGAQNLRLTFRKLKR